MAQSCELQYISPGFTSIPLPSLTAMTYEKKASGSSASHRPWMEGLKPVANPPEILSVVVGINEYTGNGGYPNLTGAVDDANAFEDFLKRRLAVPAKNIRSLRDRQATRAAIMDSFIFLRDTETAPGKTAQMIFYYAGHGAQEDIPQEWKDWSTPTGRIEMLCPSDIGATNLVKGSKEVVPGIPDRTISALLNQIAQKKGEHITVILDCCSSAGMSRGGLDEEVLIPRQIFNAPSLNASIDKSFLSRDNMRRGAISKEYVGRFRASHVLLAACGREQLAWEDPRTRSGLFTTNLLKMLCGDELDTLTYRSLMDKLIMPKRQTPHCEGKNVNRLLFGNKELSADTQFYLGRTKDNRITIEGGAAHGITVGCQFSVHRTGMKDTAFSPNPSLGCLVAADVTEFSTTLVASSSTPNFLPRFRFYAKLLQFSERHISLYSEDKTWLTRTFPPEICSALSVIIVETRDSCKFELVIEENDIRIDRHNDPVIPYIGSRMRHCIPKNDTETLYKVIKAASHYTYHLTRQGHKTKHDVRMEIHELKNDNPWSFEYDLVPVGENLLSQEPAEISVKYGRDLGMTIINNTDKVFYPYLFYFDPNDFSIVDWYSPPLAAGHGRYTTSIEITFPGQPRPSEPVDSSGTPISLIADEVTNKLEEIRLRVGVDAALPPHSRLSVGYGNSISEPWQFIIPEGQEKDIGFFRLFLSTRPSNFQTIGQLSPFVHTRGQTPSPHQDVEVTDEWSALTATIIQVSDMYGGLP